jgi:hypothetical protein
MTALVLRAAVANRWFVRRRGLVIGMTASSATPASCCSCQATPPSTTRSAWRAVMYARSAAVLLLLLLLLPLLPLILWLLRVRLPTYGRRERRDPATNAARSSRSSRSGLIVAALKRAPGASGSVPVGAAGRADALRRVQIWAFERFPANGPYFERFAVRLNVFPRSRAFLGRPDLR